MSTRIVFQSHAGSIEAPQRPAAGGGSFGFQSHAGSIEAYDAIRPALLERRFQSHAGSIEAFHATRATGVGRIRFNPTLVRLRLARGPEPWVMVVQFQSHAGSIEAVLVSRRAGRAPAQVSIPRWFD